MKGEAERKKDADGGVWVLLCQIYSMILPLTLSGRSVSINHLRTL
jgi:hypothetical protein